ncbi:hypothetical protein SUGI_0727500 [Cryptomeria japonica]|nr:hypothetical protein SUGI_0727500 [Cryptomeria japonica]
MLEILCWSISSILISLLIDFSDPEDSLIILHDPVYGLGTSSTSAVQCDLGSGSAIGDKGKRILGFTSLMTTPSILEEEEEMPRVDVVYENIQNIPPLSKTYIKSPAKLKRKRGDEDPSEPSSAAKRIDFDDPSAA